MKIIKFAKSIIILILVTSCSNVEKPNSINNSNGNDSEYYKNLALSKGDTSAYYQLNLNYIDSPSETFLYTALIMANKYEYHLAYLNVYEILTDNNHAEGVSELENIDKKTRVLALEYLKRGAEKGNKDCKYILGKHYVAGKYIEKDITLGNTLILESEK